MTPFITQLRENAAREAKTIVLPEAVDERILRAAAFLDEQNICRVILAVSEDRGRALADSFGIRLPESVLFSEPGKGENVEKFIHQLYERRRDRGMTEDLAAELVRQPLYWAASLVAQGEADGSVAGAMNTTADVLRAALQVVGLQAGSEVVSSVFMMSWEDGRVFTYGDCAVVPYPTAPQLASIAIDSAQTHQDLTGEEARVALLSFSTKGSAEHERIELVQEALETVKRKKSLLAVDGELQFDAAFVEHIGRGKAPESPVAGKANVFIFPNLDAGNISYKITERLGGATATGPIIQGFAKPMNDVSRGCKWEDVVDTAAVCALMSESADD
ncbi:MAG: phosphate acetyltransferase [Gammaproteobacteria bacterium]